MDLRATPATAPGVTVCIETLLLGVRDNRLTYRVAEHALGDEDHPDDLARRLAGFGEAGDARQVLHSTSWRFSAGRIVLTYAALPDPDPSGAMLVAGPGTTASGVDAVTPSPEHVAQADVVTHAARHLAFLHHTDELVAQAAARHPRMWDLLDAYRPDVAGSRAARTC